MPAKTKVHFEDLTMRNRYITCKVALSRYNPKFTEAQEWLDKTVMQYMIPMIPYKTGAFLGRILEANGGQYGTGRIKAAVPPQGRYLYRGISRFSGRPLHYTNPKSVPYWGNVVIREHKHELVAGVRKIVGGK